MSETPDFSGFAWTFNSGAPESLRQFANGTPPQAAAIVKTNRRRTVYRLELHGGTVFLKHHRADTTIGKARGTLRCNARREYQAGLELANAGVNVVPYLAWARWKGQSIVVTRASENGRMLAECWDALREHPDTFQAVLDALGGLLEAMARAGVYHPDFHAGNVLLEGDPETSCRAVLLDVLGVECTGELTPRVLRRLLRLPVRLHAQIPPMALANLLRRMNIAGARRERKHHWRMAVQCCLDEYRHRWPGMRKRYSRSSSVCTVVNTASGRWKLRRPYDIASAEDAVVAHTQNMDRDVNVVKRDTKRQLSRVAGEEQSLIVKEFRRPGPWGPFRADSRAWYNSVRLRTALVPGPVSHAWFKAADGRGYQIQQDVGDTTLMNELRDGTNWRQRRFCMACAARIIGLLHLARMDHGDLKPANFVSTTAHPSKGLSLVDVEALKVYRRSVPLERRKRAFEQFFENLHRHITRWEALRFVAHYRDTTGATKDDMRRLLPATICATQSA